MKPIPAITRQNFKAVFYRYYAPCYNYVVNKLQDPAKSKQLTQEVFRDVWHQCEEVAIPQPADKFIFQLTQSKLLKSIQANNELMIMRPNLLMECKKDTVDSLVQYQMTSEINTITSGLKDTEQKIFALANHEGMNATEISSYLNIDKSEVESTIHDCYNKIFNRLESKSWFDD